jgi:ribonuclease P protein component
LSGGAAPTEGFGFGRPCRLLTEAQYAEVFAARQVLRGGHFALHYRQNGLQGARIGLVIPKKQARTAVLRNAVKRQAREAFRQCRAALPAVDLVLRLARPIGRKSDATACEPAAWRAEIGTLLDQLSRRAAP